MTRDASNEYLRNAVLTASPEQLQLMLYDGAIRFSRQAKDALARRDLETSCESLLRAQKIVLEMEAGLRPDVNPEMCERMSQIYTFVHQRLVDANMHRDTVAIDEALRILEHQRETWRLLIDKLRAEQNASANAPAPAASSADSTEPTLSVEG